MKIKCRPEDFFVEELSRLRPGPQGAFGLYVLEKRGLSTFEALAALGRRLGRPAGALSAGGLKDKHALTRQQITIYGKPAPPLGLPGLKLEPLGRAERPMTGAELAGNRFAIVLRDLAEGAGRVLAERAELAAGQGLPNYFDEQRFGSLRGRQGFIARRLIEGDAEGALRLHLGSPGKLDDSRVRAQRRRAEELWGRWDQLFAALPRGNDRSVVDYLRRHPTDFAAAFELIERRLAQLYLFAYQSYLWNEILGRLLLTVFGEGALFGVRYAAGLLRFFDRVPEEKLAALRALAIPLPDRRAQYPPGELAEVAAGALAAEGITLEAFKLPGFRGLRFRGGSRAALVVPEGLHAGSEQPDDLHPGRRKLRLDFTLPPGSYATILVKFLGREMLPGSRAARRGRSGRRRGR